MDRIVVRTGGDVSIGTSGEESSLDSNDDSSGYIEFPAGVDGFQLFHCY